MNTDISTEIAAMRAELTEAIALFKSVAFPRQTQAQRAKKLGVHPSTLRRRLRIAKARANIGRVAA